MCIYYVEPQIARWSKFSIVVCRNTTCVWTPACYAYRGNPNLPRKPIQGTNVLPTKANIVHAYTEVKCSWCC